MSVLTFVKAAKSALPNYVIMVKIGKFYHSYGRDSYILSYLFNYKLKKMEDKYSTCGFPVESISKVIAELENKKINYVCLDRRNNYDEDEKMDFKNLNTYDEVYEKSRVYVNLKRRIDDIYEFLLQDIFKEDEKKKIAKIEEILYETREL